MYRRIGTDRGMEEWAHVDTTPEEIQRWRKWKEIKHCAEDMGATLAHRIF